MNESLESETFIDKLEEAVKSNKIKKKGRQKDHFMTNYRKYKINSSDKRMRKVIRKVIKKRFQASQSEKLEKQLQSEAVKKQKDT